MAIFKGQSGRLTKGCLTEKNRRGPVRNDKESNIEFYVKNGALHWTNIVFKIK